MSVPGHLDVQDDLYPQENHLTVNACTSFCNTKIFQAGTAYLDFDVIILLIHKWSPEYENRRSFFKYRFMGRDGFDAG